MKIEFNYLSTSVLTPFILKRIFNSNSFVRKSKVILHNLGNIPVHVVHQKLFHSRRRYVWIIESKGVTLAFNNKKTRNITGWWMYGPSMELWQKLCIATFTHNTSDSGWYWGRDSGWYWGRDWGRVWQLGQSHVTAKMMEHKTNRMANFMLIWVWRTVPHTVLQLMVFQTKNLELFIMEKFEFWTRLTQIKIL